MGAEAGEGGRPRLNDRERWIQSWKSRANLPAQRLQFDDLDSVPDVVRQWADVWCQEGGTKGLALTGPPGHGKTTLAVALAEYVIEHVQREPLGWVRGENEVLPLRPVYYTPYAFYVHQQKIAWKLEKQGLLEGDDYLLIEEVLAAVGLEAANTRYHARLAVLDDIGKEYHSGSGWAEGELNNLLRLRHHHGYCTVVTSNHPLAAWGDVYGAALGSFAKEAFTEVKIFNPGGDRR